MMPTDPDTARSDALASQPPEAATGADASLPEATIAGTTLADAAVPPTDAPTARPARDRRRPIAVGLALALVAVIAGATMFLSGYALGARVATTPGTPADREALFAPFWDAYDAITRQFVGTVDEKKLVEGAIGGMVTSLGDRWSQYLTSEQYRQSLQGISGRFSGIGAEMAARATTGGDAACTPLGPTCRLTVVAPTPGAPAEKAGILAGDIVTAIDGTAVDGMTMDDAVAKVRGPRGTPVTLTIVRGGAAPTDVTIVRDYIVTPAVQTKALADGTVEYIKLSGFSDQASADFAKAVADARARGIGKIVVDLRGNPGGFVSAARDVASQFIGAGPIYWQEDAAGARIEVDAKPGGAATGPDVQVVTLIDGNSASASEIVAGALQDTGRATLVGSRSFGKGTIQEWLPLPNDTGGMRLTVARWLTPKSRWIHETGLTPDVEVAADASAGGAGSTGDAVLDRALQVLADGGPGTSPSPSPSPPRSAAP
jgi:carboxyl-terminal processing protease